MLSKVERISHLNFIAFNAFSLFAMPLIAGARNVYFQNN
jgi:hypothetical protein